MLAAEPNCADTRWTEYGYKSAIEATEDFTRYYVDANDRFHRRYIDSVPHECPINADFISNDIGHMNALYSARQFADSLGLPYPAFISGMFERLMGVGLYRRVPLPNHLFPPPKPRKRKGRARYIAKSGAVVEHKAIRHGLNIENSIAGRYSILSHGWDSRFMARNYVGDPAQERALTALLTHRDIGTPRSRLRDRLEKGRISLESAQRHFPDEVVQGALGDISTLPDIDVADEGLAPYRPHCLGLIQPKTPADQCMQCPWNAKCQQLAQWAEREQMAITGYANRADRERQAAKYRQQVKRRKDAEAGGDVAEEE